MGRKFDTTHYRMPWTTTLVNKFTIVERQHRAHADPVLVRSHEGWARAAGRASAQGHQDAWITTQARALKAAGWKGYFCFHKEPEDEGNADGLEGRLQRGCTRSSTTWVSPG